MARERARGVALERAEDDVERSESQRVVECTARLVGLASAGDAGVLGCGEKLAAERAQAVGVEVARAEQVGALAPVRGEVELAVGGSEHEVAANVLRIAFLQ